MVKKEKYFFHSLSLIAIFIIGNTLIYFPRHSDIKSSILGLIISAAVSILVFFAFSFLSKRVEGEISKKLKPFCFLLLGLSCLLISLNASADYISYVSIYRMPNTPRILIAVIFVAISLYLALCNRSVILKISLFVFIYVFLSVTVLFALSFSQLDFKAVLPLKFDAFETVKSALTLLSQSFLSVLPLVFLIKTEKLLCGIKIWLLALVLGLFILLTCILNILCVFGPSLSNSLELPYASAMSVINSGKTFSRLEGFSYLNYFACSLVKTATPLFVIKTVAEKYFNKKGIYFLLPACAVLVGLSLINGLTDFMYSPLFSFVLLVFEILTIIFLGIGHTASKKQTKLD